MTLEVLTPEKTLYKGEINSINVPGAKGAFTILHNHAPIVSTLEKGQVMIESTDGKDEVIQISGGIIEVKKNKIIVLADQL